MARTAQTMLEALTKDDRLNEKEEEAFGDMLRGMRNYGRILSKPQLEWVERIYLKLDLDAEEPCENLVSSGAVQSGKKMEPLDFEKMPRPLRPPGRA